MSRLKDLEKRLRDEPDNLGLRVALAGALIEAGRRGDAIELYRSVAVAYRDQGRPQQAIAVCRSLLEIAPDDMVCQALLAVLTAGLVVAPAPPPDAAAPPARRGSEPPLRDERASAPPGAARRESESGASDGPPRRSSHDITPLPAPLPYHIAEPTAISQPRWTEADLPPSLRAERAALPDLAGIANAARQISASLIAASRQRDEEDERRADVAAPDAADGERTSGDDPDEQTGVSGERRDDDAIWTDERAAIARLGTDHAPAAVDDVDVEDERAAIDRLGAEDEPAVVDEIDEDDHTRPTTTASRSRARFVDDDKTAPRDPASAPSTGEPGRAGDLTTSALFAPIPPRSRAAILQRFRPRRAAIGTTVIRRGEVGHGLVLVVRGRLDVHAERDDGARISLDAIGPGDHVGEIGLLARTPSAAYVVAATDSELLILPAAEFYELTDAFPALRATLEITAERRTRQHERQLRA